jgi:hypothetical protein
VPFLDLSRIEVNSYGVFNRNRKARNAFMSIRLIGDKTLDELEPPAWGEPDYDSDLVQTCHRLRRKKLSEYDESDLRVMIGQGIGLRYLVPLSLDILEDNPLIEADYYPGDLLASLLQINPGFWSNAPDLRTRVESIVMGLEEIPQELMDDVASFAREPNKSTQRG